MFSKFTEECQKILLQSKREMQKLKHPYVGSEHLLLSILKSDNTVSKKLNDLGVTYDKFKDKIIDMVGYGVEENNWFLYTPLLKRVLESSVLESKDNNNSIITLDNLFISLLEEAEGIAIRILIMLGVNIDNLYSDFYNKCQNKKSDRSKKLKIYEYGNNLVNQAKKGLIDPVVARDEEVERLIEILCRRRKNNPLLLGDAGVGKSALVEELARRISIDKVPTYLKGKKIISIAMSSLVSGTKYRGEFEERINKMIKELESNPDIILFIDEIHTLVGAGGAEGAIDASNILKPALARGGIQVIGATTTMEYKKFIENDRALARRFQTLMIEESNREKTINILKELFPIYEKYHQVTVPSFLASYITDMSNKYIKDRMQPDKAIDILDEVCVRVSLKENNNTKKIKEQKELLKEIKDKKKKYIKEENFKEATALYKEEKQIEDKLNKLELKVSKKNNKNQVTMDDVIKIIEYKGNVKIYENRNNFKLIKELDNNLKKEIIGQNDAIDKLVKQTKKMLFNYRKIDKPISLLFVGPTGVGKTQLAKLYSKLLFGNDRLIRLDMSEYKDPTSINKLIGSPAGYVGYNDKNSVFEEVINHPHSLILLDEIEKAHSSVLNLFLQILDEGKIKDSSGRTIYFNNTIIIMTSNASSHKDKVGFLDTKEFIIENLKKYFSLEFINRIDDIIMFNKLKSDNIKDILLHKIKDIKNFYSKKDITVTVDSKLINEIIKKCDYDKFGARKIDKLIEDIIDEKIVEQICDKNVIINL